MAVGVVRKIPNQRNINLVGSGTYWLLRGSIDPCSHLVLLVVGSGKRKVIWLIVLEIEEKVHREEGIERVRPLDRFDFTL